MDPTANLAEQIRTAERIQAQIDTITPPDPGDVARLAELVTALNEWISRGGALPEQWRAAR